MFPILADVFAELQVVNSCGYWRPPFDAAVRFWECEWCVNASPDIDESSNCPVDAFRCMPPIWLLHSLFGDDSWSELSGILGVDSPFLTDHTRLISPTFSSRRTQLSRRPSVPAAAARSPRDSRYRSTNKHTPVRVPTIRRSLSREQQPLAARTIDVYSMSRASFTSPPSASSFINPCRRVRVTRVSDAAQFHRSQEPEAPFNLRYPRTFCASCSWRNQVTAHRTDIRR